MRKPLMVNTTQDGSYQRLAFVGPLNEDAKTVLTPLAAAAGPRCILDMGGVTQVNSIGIRDWSHFLKVLKTGRELVYERVPDEVVRTMNMVTNFQGRLTVRSVFREYACTHCDHEQTEVYELGRHYELGTVPSLAPVSCKSCGKVTEPVEPDDVYFSFLLAAG